MQTAETIELKVRCTAADIAHAWKGSAQEYRRIWAKNASKYTRLRLAHILYTACSAAVTFSLLMFLLVGIGSPFLLLGLRVIGFVAAWFCVSKALAPATTTAGFQSIIKATVLPARTDALDMTVRFGPDMMEIISVSDWQQLDRDKVFAILEDAGQLAVLFGGGAIAIPKRGMNANALARLRAALTGWNYPAIKSFKQTAVRTPIWAALAALFGVAALLSFKLPLTRTATNPTLTMPVANQVVTIPDGRVTLSNARAIATGGDGSVRLALTATLRTPDIQGFTAIEVDSAGLSMTPPKADLGNPLWYGGELPIDTIFESLPDHGAFATWAKQDPVTSAQNCAALRYNADPLPRATEPAFRRSTYVKACSTTLSAKELVSWTQNAAPALIALLK